MRKTFIHSITIVAVVLLIMYASPWRATSKGSEHPINDPIVSKEISEADTRLGVSSAGDAGIDLINEGNIGNGTPMTDTRLQMAEVRIQDGGVMFPDLNTQTKAWRSSENDIYYNGGNVGIGTTSPGTKLELKGSNSEAGLRVAYGSQYPLLYGEFKQGGSQGLIINSRANGGWADIRFQTEGNDKMFIEKAGNVGIGTTEPGAQLHVHTPIVVSQALFKVSGGTFPAETLLLVMGSGPVGIGTPNPGQRLDIAGGNGRVETGYNWLTNSDVRLKKNISTLDSSLDKISRLRGVRFDSTKEDSTQNGAGKHIGVIAQELEREYPELVVGDEKTGYKAVAYDKLTAVLIEAVKELKTKNEMQRIQNEKQQSEIEELRLMIKELKS